MVDMLDIFKTILPDGVEVDKVSERNSIFRVTVSWEDQKTTVDLNRMCAPGYERHHCMSAVVNAMSSMLITRGDLVGAKAWLDKLLNNKPTGEIAVIKLDTLTGKITRVYEYLDSFEDAALLCQLAMTRKQQHELIYITPGSNKSIDTRNEELYRKALDIEFRVLEYMNEE